jgi:hypothetical protein
MVVPKIEAETIRPDNHAFPGFEAVSSLDFAVAETWVGGQSARLVVRLHNVGRGPALMEANHEGVNLKSPMTGQSKSGSVSASVVAAGQEVVVVIASHADRAMNDAAFHAWMSAGDRCRLTVRYSDLEREHTYETIMDVGTQRPNPVIGVASYGLASPL